MGHWTRTDTRRSPRSGRSCSTRWAYRAWGAAIWSGCPVVLARAPLGGRLPSVRVSGGGGGRGRGRGWMDNEGGTFPQGRHPEGIGLVKPLGALAFAWDAPARIFGGPAGAARPSSLNQRPLSGACFTQPRPTTCPRAWHLRLWYDDRAKGESRVLACASGGPIPPPPQLSRERLALFKKFIVQSALCAPTTHPQTHNTHPQTPSRHHHDAAVPCPPPGAPPARRQWL